MGNLRQDSFAHFEKIEKQIENTKRNIIFFAWFTLALNGVCAGLNFYNHSYLIAPNIGCMTWMAFLLGKLYEQRS